MRLPIQINCAEHEYMNICPPIIELATALTTIISAWLMCRSDVAQPRNSTEITTRPTAM